MTDLPKPRGLAAMSPEKRRAIQSMGGKSSPTNFKNMSPELRRSAGRKGGTISKRKYNA